MGQRRSRVRVAVVGGVVAALMMGIAGPAAAFGSKSGYLECQSGRYVRTTSSTTGSGSLFSVGHAITGGNSKNWSSAGYHAFKHNRHGGNWAVSTNGILNSGGASCVA